MANPGESTSLNRDQILQGLAELNLRLGSSGTTGELCLFGGTVMVLAFNARLSTRDVDAIFQPASLIREMAAAVAEELGWPPEWLNDGVKGFQSSRAETTSADMPQLSHLRVYR